MLARKCDRQIEHAIGRERGSSSAGGRERVGHAAPDEVVQLRLDPRSFAAVGRQSNRLRADVIAEPRFDRIGGVEFEHRLHLVGGEAVEIGDACAGEVGDRLYKCLACDAFVDRTAVRTYIVRQPEEDFFDRPTRESAEIERPKGFGRSAGNGVRQEAKQAAACATRRSHPRGGRACSA